MLQLVESALELVDKLPGQIVSSIRQTRGFQIGNRSNLVSPRLHGNLRQVPPGTRGLGSLVLLRCMPFLVSESVAHKTRKLVAFEHTYLVEVEVSAVSGSCFGVQDQCALQLQLLTGHRCDLLFRDMATAL